MKKFFLHGLDSSSNGTKGKFFQENFPDFIVPDFHGSLEFRLQRLENLCLEEDTIILVGSSFGGLMAACFAANHRDQVKRLVLMAPALNFPGFLIPQQKIDIPTYLLIGSLDDITPTDKVIPLAEKVFSNLEINLVEEDHLLHSTFPSLDWYTLVDESRFL
jgi:pimeloyl-ACP methyl ester carboxylesterase